MDTEDLLILAAGGLVAFLLLRKKGGSIFGSAGTSVYQDVQRELDRRTAAGEPLGGERQDGGTPIGLLPAKGGSLGFAAPSGGGPGQ